MIFSRSHRKGFTFTEVLVSFFALTTVWLCVLGAAVANRKITSYSKHKISAIYLAQQKIEELRKVGCPPADVPSPGESVYLDDMATVGASDDLIGHRIVSTSRLDGYRTLVQVEVNWNEPSLGTSMTRREYCATVISNEPSVN